MDGLGLALLGLAGLAAGFVNVVAGAGSLLTLPALIFSGLDAVAANATNRIALVPQVSIGLLTLRRRGVRGGGLFALVAPFALVGAMGGALLASVTPPTWIRLAIGVAIVAFLVLSRISVRSGLSPLALRSARELPAPLRLRLRLVFVLIGAYGGFLQAGVGILILLTLSRLASFSLLQANVLKLQLGLMVNGLALGVFVWQGLEMSALRAAALAAGTSTGSYLGARATVARGDRLIRTAMTVVLLACTAKFLWDSLAHYGVGVP